MTGQGFRPVVRSFSSSLLMVLGFGPGMVHAVQKDSIVGMTICAAFLVLAVVNVGDGLRETVRARQSR